MRKFNNDCSKRDWDVQCYSSNLPYSPGIKQKGGNYRALTDIQASSLTRGALCIELDAVIMQMDYISK